jgi:Flp pilus assembly protein protease CpaA
VTFLLPKFLHIGSMFLATALAVGPLVVFTLILRTGDAGAIGRAFRFAEPVARAGGILYGLGILFGIIAALTGSIDLTARWLLTAYVTVILLGANGLYAERWMGHVEAAAQRADAGELQAWQRSNRPMWSATIAAVLTLAVVFVMVVKPTVF